ncbi:5-oxoprolinase subunit C family protein [Alkaliphilus hydrothermalis]|uniref:Biotin-dependent carboxylase-like uncharacterized protein n=1 Tax=Alkaliphilus hydrothermalis TaxID=1482730 RepID=A0ABS2NKN5_9FIRM|nr:biotin-dependent carboxyltransferase family protein [Alkaliphilus hydrothermalis]MBM7613505.1 biotin-dependent carboxylase-like uncharacterized protein [Alkaliphilus hydrothermalis]
MSNIKIIKAGLLTTLQDKGRFGFQQYGIPVAGAMDQYSLQLANLLVGNEVDNTALEFTLMGPTIQFEDNLTFAITGGEFQPTLNGKSIKMYQTIYAKKGDELAFSTVLNGCRGYLAIEGGFGVERIMGSQSTYLRGGFGGFEGRKLRSGDLIPLGKPTSGRSLGIRRIPKDMIPEYKSERVIRVIMGPEDNRFSKEGIETFLREEYHLSNQLDRMGYRLEGKKIQHLDGADIISGGINFGAIQVPGEGKPIIMMADHQTTGGYTKIANVISVDLPYLAQMKPEDKVTFKAITVEEAQGFFRRQVEGIRDLEKRFKENTEQTSSNEIRGRKKFNIIVNGKSYYVSVEERQ